MKFFIDNLEYEIVEEGDGKHVYIHDEDANGQCRIGLIDYAQQKIFIHEELSMSKKRKTLAHELVHGFLDAYAVQKESYDEEDVCDILASYGAKINAICDKYFEKETG